MPPLRFPLGQDGKCERVLAQDDGVGWSCAIPGLKSETWGTPFRAPGLLGRADLWSASHEPFGWAQDRLFDSAALRSG